WVLHIARFASRLCATAFRTLAGFPCPANGGPTSKELTTEQRALNGKARATISAELGHSRESITAVYLGR
ncbi:MAG: hypothetical protein MUO51_14325, partial [Woeseiaceae bacterium]|nr:hypothetical protein [Woeseiaceae bacterium]